METEYDENLNENAFYKTLKFEYEAVFRKAVGENWTICVPCTQSLDSYELTERNILAHVLIPNDELPETHFVNLNDQQVTICDKLVRLQNADFVPILFTEVFYADEVRYEILCIERPINFNTNAEISNSRIYAVKTLKECIDLLAVESTNESAVKKLDEIIHQFLFLASKDYFTKTVEQQVAFVRNIYDRCLQIVLADKKINAKMKISRMFTENVKISVESYVLHNTHSIVMKGLISNLTMEIGLFNRALRNLANIQLQDLIVTNSVLESIPKARNELSHLHGYSTVLGKLSSLKRCINLITNKSSNKVSVDELLPILVFLVVKSGIPTWVAQLRYVKELNFSRSDYNQGSESSFLTTTLEAVLTFIHSGLFFRSIYFNDNQLKLKIEEENDCRYVCSKSKLFWKTKNGVLLNLFQLIYEGDLQGVRKLFEKEATKEPSKPVEFRYCHPLCSCDRCEKLHSSQNSDSLLGVNTTNDNGCTPLHVAACYGRNEILDWLLNEGARPDCVDFFGSTPLHCAAMHGYQNATLLLMYAKAPLDRRDDDGNQPLHLAAVNGHVDCVKALLYFAEHAGIRLDVNAANKDGDTALHLAVRYYYADITQILLNYNANPTLKNKHGSNAFELTESLGVRKALNEKYVSAVNLMNVVAKKRVEEADFATDDRQTEKKEFGVRPLTAEAIRNADLLFKSVYESDIKTVKRLLGFSGGDTIRNADVVAPKSTYKCHPLCRCEKCVGEVCSEEEEENEGHFRKIDALSVNICDADGFTALHMACKRGSVELIRFLLDVGAKVNVRTYKELWTPLHISCISNQPAAARMLLECSLCRINLTDRAGSTALHYACQAGNVRMVELLLKYDPDTSIRNERGKTPSNECEENLSFPIMQMLKSSKTIPLEELLS